MRHLGTTALALALLLGAASCGGDDDGGEAAGRAPEAIEVGYSFGFDAGDVADRIAFQRLERGGGPKVEMVDMGGSANALTALVRGEIDAAVVPYLAAVEAAASGTGIRIVLGANMAPEFLLVARPEIRGASDLAGKTVVHSGPGTVTSTLAEAVARRAGLGPGEVRFRTIQESPAKAAALIAGHVDAATIEFVDFERIRPEHPDLHVIGRLVDIQPPAAAMVWAVSRDAVEDRPEEVRTLVDGLLDGYAFAYTDAGRREWLVEAGRTALEGERPDLVRSTYDFYRRIGFWPRRGQAVTRAQHDALVGFWREGQLIEDAPPYDDVWEPSFWAESG